MRQKERIRRGLETGAGKRWAAGGNTKVTSQAGGRSLYNRHTRGSSEGKKDYELHSSLVAFDPTVGQPCENYNLAEQN